MLLSFIFVRFLSLSLKWMNFNRPISPWTIFSKNIHSHTQKSNTMLFHNRSQLTTMNIFEIIMTTFIVVYYNELCFRTHHHHENVINLYFFLTLTGHCCLYQEGIRQKIQPNLALHCRPQLWIICDARDSPFHLLLLGTSCHFVVQEWLICHTPFISSQVLHFFFVSIISNIFSMIIICSHSTRSARILMMMMFCAAQYE